MSINEKRYVDIVSSVGAGNNVPDRLLIGRFFTVNPLVPTNNTVEFTNADDVGVYFGTNSEEYARAVMYFGWISKIGTVAPKISFAFWAEAATAPTLYGAPGAYVLATFTAISSGGFILTMGGSAQTVSGLNLSSAGSLAAVATDLQAAIRAKTGGGTLFTAATVTYDSTRACFDVVGGTTGAGNIAIAAAPSGTDLAGPLGWLAANAILSPGVAAQSITQLLIANTNADNNFGSFAFTNSAGLDQAQVVEAATWNNAQNNMYMYSVGVSAANSAAYSAALLALSGVSVTLSPITTEYPEQIPMMILAATDYTRVNAVQNYMFQENFLVTPSVTTDADADTYDAIRVNYYGQTQTAGVLRQFYQRGYMMGGSNVPTDQNTYANEIWFKDDATQNIMSLLLALPQVAANSGGAMLLYTTIQSTIVTAVANGTISVGKPLTTQQKSYITLITNDPAAWQQVQNIGWWLDVVIQSYSNNGVTEYKAVYTLIYSKDDVIRLVDGSDILI